MNTITRSLVLMAFSCLLAGCMDKTGTANSDTSPAAARPAKEDPNAINAPIAPEAYKVTLSITDAPALTSDGANATYQVQMKNEGSAAVYGAGTNAVNLGIIILGSDGTVDGPGGTREFIRVPLPLLSPGQNATVPVTISSESKLDGKIVRLATVQEGVAWHDASDTIDVGPFHIADGKFAEAPAAK